MKSKRAVVRVAMLMFALILAFVTYQSYWIAQMDIAYLWRSFLVIAGGMAFGYATSALFILWMEGDNAFE